MIKHQYAKDDNEKLIDIKSLNEENRRNSKFFCVGCGNELIARIGKIKVCHFAHKKVVTCSGETYLHLLGKQLFFDNYTDCLNTNKPFTIEMYQKNNCNHFEREIGLKCKFPKTKINFDLTHFFDKISIEKREGSFIPDIMLTSKNGNDKLFIEIAVTHLSTEKKLNSGYRIIELEVEKEEDFEPIKRKHLSIKNENIKFIGFKTKEINSSLCNGNCQINYNFFTLDKEGRCLLKKKNLSQIINELVLGKDKIISYEILNQEKHFNNGFFKKGLVIFLKQNLNVRNCFVCRYHSENDSFQYFRETKSLPIFCKFLKKECNSNEAVNCQYFKLEQNYVQNIMTLVQQYDSLDELHRNTFYESESDD